MSLIKKELTEKSGFVMEFSVDKETYAKAEYEAYKKNVKSINVPGFRKGKAPKHIIETYYGHIHGDYTMPHTVSHEGIEFSLISADYLEFIPKNIPQKTISGDIITKLSEDT